jgi:hypothetical protein
LLGRDRTRIYALVRSGDLVAEADAESGALRRDAQFRRRRTVEVMMCCRLRPWMLVLRVRHESEMLVDGPHGG